MCSDRYWNTGDGAVIIMVIHMKKYIKEIILLLLQLFMYYIFPLFAGPTDAMGMVVLIILATFVLGMVLGVISGNKIKYLWPVVVSILFIPSVFIFYNETALVHALWYLVISSVGLLMGSIERTLFNKLF